VDQLALVLRDDTVFLNSRFASLSVQIFQGDIAARMHVDPIVFLVDLQRGFIHGKFVLPLSKK